MNESGPPLETLTRRLAETPAEFLAEPFIGKRGLVNVAAVAADLLREYGLDPGPQQLAAFSTRKKTERNRLRLTLVTCWLLSEPSLPRRPESAARAFELLAGGLAEVAQWTPADDFVREPDRREELARECLKALGLRPAGETEAQAQDRLATLNTAERRRVVALARAAEARAQEIRRKMAEDAARAAEAKFMPE